KETHWWIKGPKDGQRGAGRIFDVTVRQYPEPFPYGNGHNTGFMQPQQKPSKRAQTVIDRVTGKLGAEALKRHRDANLAAFRNSPKPGNPPRIPRPKPLPRRAAGFPSGPRVIYYIACNVRGFSRMSTSDAFMAATRFGLGARRGDFKTI